MIKINLLKNLSASSGPLVKAAGGISYGEVVAADQKIVAAKILVILLLPVGLKFYEGHLLDEKMANLDSVRNQLVEITKEVDQLGSKVEVVSRFEKERARLESRLEVIRELSKSRMKEVIALDKVQGVIPQKSWLTYFGVNEGRMTIKGVALDEEEMNGFIQKLQDSPFFSDIVFSSVNEAYEGERQRRQFEVTGDVVSEQASGKVN